MIRVSSACRYWAVDGSWKVAPEGLPWIKEGSRIAVGQNVRIAKSVRIGDGVLIKTGTLILRSAEIGDGVLIGEKVRIGASSSIGRRAVIGEGADVGALARVPEGYTVPAFYLFYIGGVLPISEFLKAVGESVGLPPLERLP